MNLNRIKLYEISDRKIYAKVKLNNFQIFLKQYIEISENLQTKIKKNRLDKFRID